MAKIMLILIWISFPVHATCQGFARDLPEIASYVCTGETCDKEDQSMLQARASKEVPAKQGRKEGSLVPEEAHLAKQSKAKRDELLPYGLRFEYLIGEDTGGAFRASIDTAIAGETFSLLIDTGSSTLALCNGTTDGKGNSVPPAKPVPEISPTGGTAVVTYGPRYGCPQGGLHGFVGSSFHGNIGIGNLKADASYAIMGRRHGERGNACGLALSGSVGAARLEGIFGFAGALGNGPYFGLETCTTTDVNFTTCTWPQGCHPHVPQYIEAAFSDVLLPAAQAHKQFNIAWSGNLGNNSGILSFGEIQSRQGIRAILHWDDKRGIYYGLNMTAFDAQNGSSPLQGAQTSVQSDVSSAVVDTGSPAIQIPQATCHAIDKHFKLSRSTVTILISVQAASGQTSLELPIEKAFWDLGQAVFECTPAKGPWTGLLGLALWLWYDTVHFDIGGGAFEFFPRQDPIALQSKILKLAASK